MLVNGFNESDTRMWVAEQNVVLYKAISKYGLSAPDAIIQSEFGSNLANNKRYDQILHHPNVTGSVFSDHGGVLDFYKGDYKSLLPYKDLTKTKFTYQLSDHLPPMDTA